jgi:hypothetical protein
MHTQPLNHRLSNAQLNRLHDQALRDARVLRDAAIDDFWHRTHATLRAGLAHARRVVLPWTPRQQHRTGVGA